MKLFNKFAEVSNDLDISLDAYCRINAVIKRIENKLREAKIPGTYEIQIENGISLLWGERYENEGGCLYIKDDRQSITRFLTNKDIYFISHHLDKITELFESIMADTKLQVRNLNDREVK